jgi:riboflavin synthase
MKKNPLFCTIFPMFTGIIKGIGVVVVCKKRGEVLHYAVQFPPHLLDGIEQGASISLDGVCQTVVGIDRDQIWFDAIHETLEVTTFKKIQAGNRVNLERAARFGDEIGGHLLSGHIYGVAPIQAIENNIYTLTCPAAWMPYFFPKGYIALDGISLTLVTVDKTENYFTVHLIPETLARTTLGQKKVGECVNIEIDTQTQATVDTLFRLLRV